MRLLQQELLFDLIESEADILYFFDRKDFKATKPAIIITSSPVGHFPKRKGDHYTLWFGAGIERFTFKTKKEAIAKAEEFLSKYPLVKPRKIIQ